MRTGTRKAIATATGALALLALASSASASSGDATSTGDEAAGHVLLAQRPGDTATQAPVTVDDDRRSPDTRDAARAATPTFVTAFRDLTSPDTRDAALALARRAVPAAPAKANRFDWTDAGIGATSGFGIALLAAAAVLLIRRSNGRQLAV